MGARLLAVALIVAGCGGAPDLVTPRGVEFHLNGADPPDRAQLAEDEERFAVRLHAAGGFDDEAAVACWRRAEVHVEPAGPFPCAGRADRLCAGEQYGPRLKVAAWSEPGEAAWLHELLHWLQECHDGQVDPAHADPVWRIVDANDEAPLPG